MGLCAHGIEVKFKGESAGLTNQNLVTSSEVSIYDMISTTPTTSSFALLPHGSLTCSLNLA